MKRIQLLAFLLFTGFQSTARAHESLTAQAARVQGLLRALQEQPELKVDVLLTLRPALATSQAHLAREHLNPGPRPGRIPSKDPLILIAPGELFILPKIAGQRSCEAIQKDWRILDRVYQEVSDLALELEEVYSHPSFCAPCAVTVLTTLKQATQELEEVSRRLNQDGDRQLRVVWGPQAFVQDREIIFTALSWDRLVYFNLDGVSQAGDATHPLALPAGLVLRTPLLQQGIQFQTEVTAERACSPGFEIRLDALALGFSLEENAASSDTKPARLQKVPLKIILVTPY